MRSLSLLAIASGAVAWRIHLNPPAWGTVDKATGFVEPIDNVHPNDYKVAVLLSGDYGATWWDKTHAQYLLAGVPDPGNAQNAACPLDNNWQYTLTVPWSASPENDAVAALWRAYLVPASYDMRWPQYQIEGIPMRGDLVNAAVAWAQVNRQTGEEQHGEGLQRPDGQMAPPPAPSATPTASPSTGASPSPSSSSSPPASVLSPNATAVASGAWRAAGLAMAIPALMAVGMAVLV